MVRLPPAEVASTRPRAASNLGARSEEKAPKRRRVDSVANAAERESYQLMEHHIFVCHVMCSRTSVDVIGVRFAQEGVRVARHRRRRR